MGTRNGKILVGFVLNVALVIAFFSTEMADGGALAVAFFTLAAAGVIVTGMGIAMLAHGDPAGGILGAAGSAIFVPIGLICLIGCLQSRDKLRNAALATADASGSGTVAEPAGGPADPAASAVSGGTPDGPAAGTPLAAYKFADYSPLFGVATLFFLAALFVVWAQAPALLGGVVICAARFMVARTQRKLYVCALYADHLDYASGIWATSQVTVPYAAIVEAVVSSSKVRLVIEREGGRTRVSIPLSLMAGCHRREACTAIADKMRELGVLRED